MEGPADVLLATPGQQGQHLHDVPLVPLEGLTSGGLDGEGEHLGHREAQEPLGDRDPQGGLGGLAGLVGALLGLLLDAQGGAVGAVDDGALGHVDPGLDLHQGDPLADDGLDLLAPLVAVALVPAVVLADLGSDASPVLQEKLSGAGGVVGLATEGASVEEVTAEGLKAGEGHLCCSESGGCY